MKVDTVGLATILVDLPYAFPFQVLLEIQMKTPRLRGSDQGHRASVWQFSDSKSLVSVFPRCIP